MSREVTGIVLAGGRSARFGGDKLAASVGESTVLGRALDAVSRVASEILVVGPPRDMPALAGIQIGFIADLEPFGGPLQALGTALGSTGTELAIVVAGDAPSLVPQVLALLLDTLDAAPDVDAFVLADPREPDRRQPLPLAIRVVPGRAAATASLDAGERSLARFLDGLTIGVVPVEAWQPLDPQALTLLDVDVPADLLRVRASPTDERGR